jgi:ABC-type nitrate/sulfonate/bicarbonate transport system permease component
MSGLAGILYAVASLAARWLAPWAGGEAMVGLGTVDGARTASTGISRGVTAIPLVVASIVLILGVWYAFIWVFRLDGFFAKTPLDVFHYLVVDVNAAEHRDRIFGALSTTLVDTGVGYLVGTAVALAFALAMAMLPAFEQAVMPTAIVLRSIPIVAMAPLISLVFGRGLFGVVVVVGLVTFFPTLVLVVAGLRSAPTRACEVIASFGGSSLTVAHKVRIPYAVPSFFAAARIAIPAAIGGATLVEWLSTGSGIGNLLVLSYSASRFGELWSASVVIVAISVAAYSAAGILEGWAVRHAGLSPQP